MAEISAALVKELREKTGAGMMDCKKALAETQGNLEGAVDWLRKKGLSSAAKKAGRVASEGLVGVVSRGAVGALVEVNAETDFVARNTTFQAFVTRVAEVALDVGTDTEAILAAPFAAGSRTVKDELTQMIATIGENMTLRRAAVLKVDRGVVATYMHSALAPGLGKIGTLVAVESAGDPVKLAELGRRIAMHVAAANPLFLAIDKVDPAALDRERNVLIEQAKTSGKPMNIIEKMVEGRIRKYYEEVVLLEQISMLDQETKIAKVVEQGAKDAGAPAALVGFARHALGEGIEKQDSDFAAEVAKVAAS